MHTSIESALSMNVVPIQAVSTAAIHSGAASQSLLLGNHATGAVLAGTFTASFSWTLVYS